MARQIDFPEDIEFSKLLVRSPDIDLARAALELARDAYPDLDFAPTLEWLDSRAQELAQPIARCRSESAVLRELAECLASTHRLHGDENAYSQADSSYLPCVIQTTIGIPISLSIVYMAVAKKLHIDLQGVGAPMHFITRYDTASEPLFLDAFAGGRVLNQRECQAWIASISGLSPSQVQVHLKPADNRSIIIRMLNNLKRLHVHHEDWPSAWRVQCRLSALQPDSYAQRRDLGVTALRSQQPALAIELLESCLATCPDTERADLRQSLDEAHRQLAVWN